MVHSVGGWISLAAILVLGPRTGRFKPEPKEIEGHNLPIAVLGVFLLWVGWFGFNAGSTLKVSDDIPRILINTVLAPVAGGLAALAVTWVRHRKPKVDSDHERRARPVWSASPPPAMWSVPPALCSSAPFPACCSLPASARWKR